METIAVPSKEDTADAIVSQALVPVMLELATRARQSIELGALSLPPHGTIRGKIDWTEGQPVVDVFGQSNRHDRWEWSREFRPDAHEHVLAHQVHVSKPAS